MANATARRETGTGKGTGTGTGEAPARGGFVSRRIPRSLAAAAHVTAVGAWVFALSVGAVALLFSALGDDDGFLFAVVLLLTLGPVVAVLLLGGLAVAAVGTTIVLPLAVVWWRNPKREGNGGFALGHFAVATLVAAFVLLRIVL